MTPQEFRALMPEFNDPVKYPDARIAMYLKVAPQWVGADAWGESFELGTALYVAHFLTWAGHGVAGVAPRGAVTSKKVGDVSTNYADTGTDEGSGWWSSTPYGRQWWALRASLAGPAFAHFV